MAKRRKTVKDKKTKIPKKYLSGLKVVKDLQELVFKKNVKFI